MPIAMIKPRAIFLGDSLTRAYQQLFVFSIDSRLKYCVWRSPENAESDTAWQSIQRRNCQAET
jgi:hypothetical protein